jgi:hypothetical protein
VTSYCTISSDVKRKGKEMCCVCAWKRDGGGKKYFNGTRRHIRLKATAQYRRNIDIWR